jgi:hydroxyacylglutathione hydrolase
VAVVPVVDAGLGNSAYVVDLGDGGALVVDPERDPRRYLEVLEQRGLTARFVVETHLHADFVSGGPELAALGARLLAPRGSDLQRAHHPLADGDELELGGLRLQVIATPGHTPEHLAYLLVDGSQPVAVFSGGTLLAGGVARTDLLVPEQTEPLARAAYRSIRARLFTLPDDLPAYPTHGAGSFCAAAPGGERTTTIGAAKATNPLLADDPDEDTFVARLLGGYGSYPPYFLELRDVNRAGPTVYGPPGPRLAGLSAQQVQQAMDDGAELVDARSSRAFADGHIPGALANPWRSAFATWLGWLVERDREVVFVTDDTIEPTDLAWAAATVGFERLRGVLAGGMDAWTAAGRPVATTPLVAPDAIGERRIVDVRQRPEHEAGHVVSSTNIELGTLTTAPEQVAAGPVLLHCGHSERAMSAASLLERAGHTEVAVLDGGPTELATAGHGLEAGA